MTNITMSEIKIIFFSVVFVALTGVFVALYALQPVTSQQYTGETSAANASSSTSSTWINGMLSVLPAPFNSADLVIIVAIFIAPVSFMLAPIAVRYLKDLVTQWV